METIDNQQTVGADNLDYQTQGSTNELAQDSGQNVPRGTSEPATDVYKPFINGKEKFKVDGEEVEWDWETTRKFASLGKTAYQRMQEASDLKKRTESAYKQLLDLAQKDPETLIRALNPNYNGPMTQQAASAALNGSGQVTDQDPRDLELRRTQEEVHALRSMMEQQQVDKEREAIQQELSDAESKYPTIKGDKFAINYIKSEYRKALQAGYDVTIDDIAFLVSQELQQQKQERVKQTQTRLAEKRKQAPVQMVASASDSGSKPMSLEDVKRLAGRF